jgi:hypothetical protein
MRALIAALLFVVLSALVSAANSPDQAAPTQFEARVAEDRAYMKLADVLSRRGSARRNGGASAFSS